ncbi:MAG: hypothetical protein Q8J85_07065 [Sulfuricurvum sp.]|nr:hypothetical protein [Sulfuricurvum sp.]MDP3023014.1 hypothetical protein [Sulfuricurvum sp.]
MIKQIILIGIITTISQAKYIVDKTVLKQQYEISIIEQQKQQIKKLKDEKKELKRLYNQCMNYQTVLKKETINILTVSDKGVSDE